MPLEREIDPEEFERQKTGVFGFGDQRQNESPWFTRWYVWVLTAAVLIGVVVGFIVSK
jgi:hypothetical protein